MKRLFLLTGMLIALGFPLLACSSDYRRLIDGCDTKNSKGYEDAYRECVVYVSAIVDILEYWANYNLRPCISPDHVSNGQIQAVVNRSLSLNPKATDEGVVIAAALSNAFTCNR